MKHLTIILSLAVCLSAHSQDTLQIDYELAYNIAVSEYEEFEKSHGHYFQTDNVNMHYSTWGNPSDVPFLWLHGTNSNTTEIVDLVDSLTTNDYYVIAIDYYGHGLTPFPEKDVSIYDVADNINALIEHLSIQKIIIGGWSRGGVIASSFYDAYPSKVMGLVLEDGGSASFLKVRQGLGRNKIEELYASMYSSQNDTTFTTKFEAFKHYFNPKWSDSQYWWFSLIRENKNGEWEINPGLSTWLGQTDSKAGVRNIFQTTKAPLFESSALLLSPEIVYRLSLIHI